MDEQRKPDSLNDEQREIYEKYRRGLTIETAEQSVKTATTITGAIALGLGQTWSAISITIIGAFSLFCLHLVKIYHAKAREGPEDDSS